MTDNTAVTDDVLREAHKHAMAVIAWGRDGKLKHARDAAQTAAQLLHRQEWEPYVDRSAPRDSHIWRAAEAARDAIDSLLRAMDTEGEDRRMHVAAAHSALQTVIVELREVLLD